MLIKTKFNGVYYRESKQRMYKGKPDRSYYIKYYRGKKQVEEKVGWLSEGYSAQYAMQVRNEKLADKRPHIAVKYTFKEAFELYLDWAKVNKKSWKDDKKRYDYRISKFFDNYELGEIKTSDVHSFVAMLKQCVTPKSMPYSPQSVHHFVIIIRRVFNFMIDTERFVGTNPAEMSKVKLEKFDNSREVYLYDEEIERMLKVLNDEKLVSRDEAALVKFALYTGFRRSELFNLMWRNVDLERGIVRLVETKGKKNQTMIIPKVALDVLKTISHVRSEYVFANKLDKQRTSVRDLWTKVKQLADIRDEVHFHDIRHTFGTVAATVGVPIEMIQKMMTHKNIRTTQSYAHIVDKRYQEAADLMNDAFGKFEEESED